MADEGDAGWRDEPSRRLSVERDLHVTVSWHAEFDAAPKQLDSGGLLVVPFRATFTGADLQVELMLDVVGGAPACTRYTVTSLSGSGLESRTSDVVRGLRLGDLMMNALSMSAGEHNLP